MAGDARPRLPVVDVMAPASSGSNGPLPPVAADLAAAPQTPAKKSEESFLLDEATADQSTTDSVLLTDDPKKAPGNTASTPANGGTTEQPPAAETAAAAPEGSPATTETAAAPTAAPAAEITPESLVAPVAPVSPYTGKKLDADAVAQASPDLLEGDEEDADEEMLFDNEATKPMITATNEPPALKAPAADVRPGGENALPVAPPVDVDEHASTQEAQLARRPTMMGFKGFCPVTLRNQRKLVEAKPEYSAEREGVVYQFASAEALAEFQIAPEKYVPARSGQDVVLTSGGEEKTGTLDHAVWFRGKLYLFATAESRLTFVASPAKYATP